MNVVEIVARAKELDKNNDMIGVIELLKAHMTEIGNNLEVMALYQKNVALNTLLEKRTDLRRLYDYERCFDGVPEADVMDISELRFRRMIAVTYLSEYTDEEKLNSVFGLLEKEIHSLGNRLDDYHVLECQLEKFLKILTCYGYEKTFYNNLSDIVNWKSKVSENILLYIVNKVKPFIISPSDQELFNTYTKDMTENIFSYEEKPILSGDRLVVVNIKSEEARDFWKGYFALVKEIRQKEYDAYRQAISDKNHELYSVYAVGEHIHERWLQLASRYVITTADVVTMQMATGCAEIEVSESELKSRLSNAEKSYNTVKINPIWQVKIWFNKLLGKK